MGTIERGESNLSFQNIVRVAKALNVTLSSLFAGLENRAADLTPEPLKPTVTTPRRTSTTKRGQ